MKRGFFVLFLCACGAAAHPVAQPSADDLGTLSFPVTGGNAAARADFLRGLLAYHSFWYAESTRLFEQAEKEDPTFVMARWGAAMSHSQILFGNDDLAAGRAELAKISPADEASVTPRERAWIGAARALFAPDMVTARRDALVAAMEQVHADYPDDDEASLILALALISDPPPGQDVDLRTRVRAGSLALAVFAKNPRHPGAAHYLIHAFDTPDLAILALPAARAYAKIAPAAYHARHMPAHIFARLGLWKEALASCQSAWQTSIEWVKQTKQVLDNEDFHSLSWIIAIDLELGKKKDAEAALATYAAAVKQGLGGWRGGYLDSVSQYLEDTKEWSRVDELLAPLDAPRGPSGMNMDPNGPPPELGEAAGVDNIRLEVASELKDVDGVKKYQAALDDFRTKMRPYAVKAMGEDAVAAQEKLYAPMEEIGKQIPLLRAQRDEATLLPLLQKVVAFQDQQPLGEPGVLGGTPHEGLAMTYDELGQWKDGLAEWEHVLHDHPNHARVLLGAARDAAKSGDAAKAKQYYQQLLAVWADADPDLPDLAEVKAGATK